MRDNNKTDNIQIVQKAIELVQLTFALDKLIPEDKEYLQATRSFMLENAYIIPAKMLEPKEWIWMI